MYVMLTLHKQGMMGGVMTLRLRQVPLSLNDKQLNVCNWLYLHYRDKNTNKLWLSSHFASLHLLFNFVCPMPIICWYLIFLVSCWVSQSWSALSSSSFWLNRIYQKCWRWWWCGQRCSIINETEKYAEESLAWDPVSWLLMFNVSG